MLKANQQRKEQLDRAGRLVLRAAASSAAESESASSSPFLFTRIRVAIKEESRRQEESGSWLTLLFVARRAVPAMALIALLTAGLMIWSAQTATPTTTIRLGEEALFDSRDPGVEETVLANRNGPSRDEVFSIVVDREKR